MFHKQNPYFMKIELKSVMPDKVVRIDAIKSCYTVLHQFGKKTLLQDCVSKEVLLLDSSYVVRLQNIENNYFFWNKGLLNSWDL